MSIVQIIQVHRLQELTIIMQASLAVREVQEPKTSKRTLVKQLTQDKGQVVTKKMKCLILRI